MPPRRSRTEEIPELIGLPENARREYLKDHTTGLTEEDPGIDQAIDSGIAWLCLAQDKSASQDGGVADTYSLIDGWGSSYPETTGYIIPTMLKHSTLRNDQSVRERARRMLDWLISIQFADGSFHGGTVRTDPKVPTVFNTGQILLGLAAGVREFGQQYYKPMCRAADWLVQVQDEDGCWRRYESPLVDSGEKTYSAHVAWGLLEAARMASDKRYEASALANLKWVVSQQTANGWFPKCDFDDPSQPLTHTLAYAWRGVLEGFVFAHDARLLEAGANTGEAFLRLIRDDGFIPGRINSHWEGTVPWACLAGTAQIAHCWLLLYQLTREVSYREAGYKANSYLRRRVRVDGPPQVVGGVKGAFPVDGDYCDYSYVNWGCKFFVDSNILEKEIREREGLPRGDSTQSKVRIAVFKDE